MNPKFFLTFALLISLLLIDQRRAYAYLDPGSGSYLLQLLIAAMVTSVFTIKIYWNKIVGFFKSKKSDKSKDDPK